jgi:hypothetical protein
MRFMPRQARQFIQAPPPCPLVMALGSQAKTSAELETSTRCKCAGHAHQLHKREHESMKTMQWRAGGAQTCAPALADAGPTVPCTEVMPLLGRMGGSPVAACQPPGNGGLPAPICCCSCCCCCCCCCCWARSPTRSLWEEPRLSESWPMLGLLRSMTDGAPAVAGGSPPPAAAAAATAALALSRLISWEGLEESSAAALGGTAPAPAAPSCSATCA